jgi:hypothetical protein
MPFPSGEQDSSSDAEGCAGPPELHLKIILAAGKLKPVSSSQPM